MAKSDRREPPADIEYRVAPVTVEYRAETDGTDKPTITGYAAVFNELSVDLGGFREKIEPGAFERALKEKQDVRALFNHNPDRVLGRSPDTLRMSEDDTGLAVEISPPLAESALLELMRRGDITQMSFGFLTRKHEWEEVENGPDIRTVQDVDLFDVSVVTYPAYPQTDAAVRSQVEWRMALESEHNAAPEPDPEPVVDTVLLRLRAKLAAYLGGSRA